jgi:hypothetical protein
MGMFMTAAQYGLLECKLGHIAVSAETPRVISEGKHLD